MAQRPTFPDPYLRGIDATQDNEFKCLINDKDIITNFVFTIYKCSKDASDKKIWNEEPVYTYEGNETIYGGSGNDSYLIVEVPADRLTNKGEDDIGEYKWKAKLTDSYGNIVESREYFFTCIASPELTINSSNLKDGILSFANAKFNGTYTCESPLVCHRFILKRDDEIIYDTKEVYSQYLNFEYDLFFNGEYTLTLQVENEAKMSEETFINFSVEYLDAPTVITPKCYETDGENSIIIDLSDVMVIPGTIIGESVNEEELNGVLCLPKDSELFWQERTGVSENLDINPNDFTVHTMFNLPYGKQGKLLELSGDETLSVYFDGFEISDSRGVRVPIGNTASAVLESEDSIDNSLVYCYDFSADTEYNFDNTKKYVFQNPLNIGSWLLTLNSNALFIKSITEEGAEVDVQ